MPSRDIIGLLNSARAEAECITKGAVPASNDYGANFEFGVL
jgi:hypothetical protein